MAGIRPGTEGANALRQEWNAEIKRRPNEEAKIIDKLMSPEGVEKIGNQLNIRILPRITAQTIASTAQGTGFNYHTGTIENVTATPTFSLGAVELPDHLMSKLRRADQNQLKAGYRKQLMAALNVVLDATAGQLGAGFSTLVGLPSNFDQTLLLAAKGLLVTNAREFVNFNDGKPSINLVYHPSQMQYVDAIVGITNAQWRGDKANPTVSGVVHDAWGFRLNESGNVFVSAGVAYNMLFTEEAGVIGYNLEPMIKPLQDFEATVRMIAETEAGIAEVFDEAGVGIRSAA